MTRRIVDISMPLENDVISDPQPYSPKITYFDHHQSYEQMAPFFPGLKKEDLPDGEAWAVEMVQLITHNGTHLDAPYHFASTMNRGERAITIDEVPLDWCMQPGVKLDFRHFDDGYVATADDVAAELTRIGHDLQPLDIPVVHELPGVGRNLQDHVDCVLAYACTKPVTLYRDLRADRMIRSVAEGMLFGRGVATTFPYEAGAFLKSRADLLAPDIQVHFMPALEKTANLHPPAPFKKASVEETHGFSLRVGPLNPVSRGWIGLRSADPAVPPLIQPNYLQDEADCRTTITGIRMVRDVIGQPAFAASRGRELAPGGDMQSDGELTAWLRANAMTTFHPVGTCRMGGDPMAVVDARLAVHGIAGLRVADASVMPVIVSGNTNAPAIMIGEKAAEFIRGAAPPADAPSEEN